ncbi:MAG: hypothetical protein LBP88_01630 [Treponema sp.]|nr:hypothetical protein [Treponema sp.]
MERGYNRDHEALPQINAGVVYGEPSAFISLNYQRLAQFYHQVKQIRFKRLNRRSGQQALNWEQFGKYRACPKTN